MCQRAFGFRSGWHQTRQDKYHFSTNGQSSLANPPPKAGKDSVCPRLPSDSSCRWGWSTAGVLANSGQSIIPYVYCVVAFLCHKDPCSHGSSWWSATIRLLANDTGTAIHGNQRVMQANISLNSIFGAYSFDAEISNLDPVFFRQCYIQFLPTSGLHIR
jgi:hypothetical protein